MLAKRVTRFGGQTAVSLARAVTALAPKLDEKTFAHTAALFGPIESSDVHRYPRESLPKPTRARSLASAAAPRTPQTLVENKLETRLLLESQPKRQQIISSTRPLGRAAETI